MTNRAKPKPGDVVEIDLPDNTFAYARVYKDATIGIYRCISITPNSPPLGSRDFLFFVGIYDDALKACQRVGRDPFEDKREDGFPPARCIRDPITGEYSIYDKGEIIPADPADCSGMEEAAVWELDQIKRRILNTMGRSQSFQ